VIRDLLIVAFGFRLAGMLLAAASITTLVDAAGTWFEIRRLPPLLPPRGADATLLPEQCRRRA
jgi:hypothetical protein